MEDILFVHDAEEKKIIITCEIDADIMDTWNAWTDEKQLEKWWGPEPWKAVSKKFDFTEGGEWLYAMKGPNDEIHWSKQVYSRIREHNYFKFKSFFCDEQGNQNFEIGASEWEVNFTDEEPGTGLEIILSFETEVAMNTLIAMKFQEGFSQGLHQLEKMLPSAK